MKTELNVSSICGFVFCFKTVIIRRNNRVHTTLDDAHPAQTNDNSDAFYLGLATHPVTHNSYLHVYTSRYDPETLLSFLFYSLFSFFSLFFVRPINELTPFYGRRVEPSFSRVLPAVCLYCQTRYGSRFCTGRARFHSLMGLFVRSIVGRVGGRDDVPGK